MAGSRHHQVPQFLMRGFASRIIPKKKQDTVLVWYYRKNTKPVECSTADVGVEEKFYKDGELNVDPEITELEGPFATCVDELRTKPDGYRVQDPKFLEFVVHLTSRTKHMRDSFINTGGFAIDSLLTYLANNWRDYFGRYFSKHREEITRYLEQHLAQTNASPFQKAIARQLVNSLTSKQIVQVMERTENFDALFPSIRDSIAGQLNDIGKQAHIKALLKSVVSEPRLEHFQKFHWFVCRVSETLILGDVCSLFLVDSKFKSLGGTKENITRIYVPISSDCVVVANVKDELPSVQPAELNEASARVSRDYFVSKERSEDMIRLQALLGIDSELLTDAEMKQILNEAIEERL